ncbi:MAG: hypothetical protein VR67_01715 [Peptococcaceae bacterium BRH_c8a]|nr:MAG: hypothetical protein VR67_01715 [Peptococcaceae bacterium BRH_c8a]
MKEKIQLNRTNMEVVMNFKKNIEDICTRLDGVDLFGVAPIERFLDLPENKRPTNLLPDADPLSS